MAEHYLKHYIDELVKPMRADIYVAERLRLLPRSQLKQRLIALKLNGEEVKLSKKVKRTDLLELYWRDPPPMVLKPEAMDLEIIYEDEDVVVINKPSGLVVHPGAGQVAHTLVNGLLWHVAGLKTNFPQDGLRPGIVHRLDKDTSGVIIAAKHPSAQEFLCRQFRLHKVHKLYLALVQGVLPKAEDRIETLLVRDRRHRQRFRALPVSKELPVVRGRLALTEYCILRQTKDVSLVALKPLTGRTHQLRVHLKYLGCPILGDRLYGHASGNTPLFLHAFRLALRLPKDKRRHVFRAPLPAHFKKMIHSYGLGDRAR